MTIGEGRVAIDWDALAPYWHLFEHGGLSARGLSLVEAAVIAPCLFVGSGLGTLATRLANRLGGAVTIADSSREMMRRASRLARRGACCDARGLPFADRAFATAVCATGVLEPMDDGDRVRALTELRRTTRAGGVVMVAIQAPSPADAWALLDAWRDGRASPSEATAALDALARELGDRVAAHALMRRSLPRLAPGATPAAITGAAARAGLRTTATLDAGSGVAWMRLV